ncbi:MAG: hypothetical protein IKF59_13245 [Lachnospiraceae bacterium]|nr:hypothetical protein [Lachnospiraceae bacterium]
MIQDNILRFDYNDGNGKLVINLLNFFPSGKGRVRKLMQILALSDWRRGQVARELIQWLEDRQKEANYEATLASYANRVVEARTKHGEMQEAVDKQQVRVEDLATFIKSLPRGDVKKKNKELLKTEKEKLKTLKEKRKRLKDEAAYYNGAFIKTQAVRWRMQENTSLIRVLSAGWD